MPEFHDPAPEVVPRPAPRFDWTDRVRAVADDPVSGIVALAFVALVAGGFWYRAGLHRSAATSRNTPVVTPRSQAPRIDATTTSSGSEVVVHISGAVIHAGLYHLPAVARVVDAIAAAGGPTADADVNRLNLAARVADGQHIVVPRVGEPLVGDIAGDTANHGPISLNTASVQELESLPRIGPALAQAIIDYRTRHGGFKTIAELGNVRGIGDRLLDDLRPLVVL